MSRLALVTGGTTGNDGVGGIGAAICTALAGTGHRVAVADIDGAGAKRTASTIAGSGHRGIQLDVRDSDSVNEHSLWPVLQANRNCMPHGPAPGLKQAAGSFVQDVHSSRSTGCAGANIDVPQTII